jgi:hypothetical protein
MHNFGVHKLPIASKAVTLTWLHNWFYFSCLTIFNSQTILFTRKKSFICGFWLQYQIYCSITLVFFNFEMWKVHPNFSKSNEIYTRKTKISKSFCWKNKQNLWIFFLAIIYIFIGTIICQIDFTALSYVLYNQTLKKRGSISAEKEDEIVVFQTLKLYWCSNDRNYSKFNMSCTLDLKFAKSPPQNPTHQGHANGIKS